MNRDLAAKIRAHLDEMAALLDREESADAPESAPEAAAIAAEPEQR